MTAWNKMIGRFAIVALMSGLLPSFALAAPLTGAQVRVDDEYAWVLLLSPESLPEPSMRIDRGEIKMWFSDIEHERLTTEGDGLAIRDVRVRSGAGHSTLVHVRIGDRRELAAEDMQVVPFAGGTALRIRRSALPMLPAADLEVAPEITEETSEIAVAEGGAVEEEAATEEAEEAPLFATQAEGAIAGEMEADDASALPVLGGGQRAPIGMLIMLTIALGAVLLGVKRFAKKTKAPPADIDVVSTKRIGPRHQLIVVRALGEEHLLSVNAGQTQRLTSVSIAPPPPSAMPLAPSKPRDDADEDLELKLGLKKRSIFHGFDQKAASERPPAMDNDERFGARLLELATRKTDSMESRPSSASSISGLLELKARG